MNNINQGLIQTKFDMLVEKVIDIEDGKAELIEKIKELEKQDGVPYLTFASLCKWEHYKEVHSIFRKWRNSLKFVPSISPDLEHGRLLFNFDVYSCQNVFIDLAHLINHDVLNCSLKEFARFIVEWTNLGDIDSNVYMQLRRYKDNYK